MEHLSIHDHGDVPGGAHSENAPPTAPALPQLPPQMFTTAAQLLDLTDSEVPLQLIPRSMAVCEEVADVRATTARR